MAKSKKITGKAFYDAIYDAALKAGMTEAAAQVTAAQACLETGYGKSVEGNNAFGIKAGKSWKGDTQVLTTWEGEGGKKVKKKQTFRKYDSFEEGLQDRFAFMDTNYPGFSSAETVGDAYDILRNGGKYGAYATDDVEEGDPLTYEQKLNSIAQRNGGKPAPPGSIPDVATELDLFRKDSGLTKESQPAPVPRSKPTAIELSQADFDSAQGTAQTPDAAMYGVRLPPSKTPSKEAQRDAQIFDPAIFEQLGFGSGIVGASQDTLMDLAGGNNRTGNSGKVVSPTQEAVQNLLGTNPQNRPTTQPQPQPSPTSKNVFGDDTKVFDPATKDSRSSSTAPQPMPGRPAGMDSKTAPTPMPSRGVQAATAPTPRSRPLSKTVAPTPAPSPGVPVGAQSQKPTTQRQPQPKAINAAGGAAHGVRTVTVRPDGTEIENQSAGSTTAPAGRPSNVPDPTDEGLQLLTKETSTVKSTPTMAQQAAAMASGVDPLLASMVESGIAPVKPLEPGDIKGKGAVAGAGAAGAGAGTPTESQTQTKTAPTPMPGRPDELNIVTPPANNNRGGGSNEPANENSGGGGSQQVTLRGTGSGGNVYVEGQVYTNSRGEQKMAVNDGTGKAKFVKV